MRIFGGFGMLIFGGFGMLIVGGFLSFAGGLSTTSAKPDTTMHNPKINSEVSFFILSSTEKLTGRTIVFKPNELLPVSVANLKPLDDFLTCFEC